MFGPARGPWSDDSWKGWWGKNPPYHVPVFVLTHHARAPITMEGGTTFHFVTDGIHAALERAKEAALAKAEDHSRRLEAVIDNAPGIMFESEGTPGQASYRIPYVNQRVEQILGYTRDEWMQNPTLWCEIIHPDDISKVFPKASQVNA